MDIDLQNNKHSKDLSSAENYMDSVYNELFSGSFSRIFEMKRIFENDGVPISDANLEVILTDVPLILFDIAEALNKLKLRYEIIRLKVKQNKNKYESKEDEFEDNLMVVIYKSLIDRVSSEISYSRELVMSAKKIWDRRRETENIHNVSPSTLPGYKESSQSYVHG